MLSTVSATYGNVKTRLDARHSGARVAVRVAE